MDTDVVQDQPPGIEVVMVEAETVRQIRALAALGWGSRRIAGELGVARKTVQRYVRGATAATQLRPTARSLTVEQHATAIELFATTAEGNAVVVADLFAEQGVVVHARTVQRIVRPHRDAKRAAEVATVRFRPLTGTLCRARGGLLPSVDGRAADGPDRWTRARPPMSRRRTHARMPVRDIRRKVETCARDRSVELRFGAVAITPA